MGSVLHANLGVGWCRRPSRQVLQLQWLGVTVYGFFLNSSLYLPITKSRSKKQRTKSNSRQTEIYSL